MGASFRFSSACWLCPARTALPTGPTRLIGPTPPIDVPGPTPPPNVPGPTPVAPSGDPTERVPGQTRFTTVEETPPPASSAGPGATPAGRVASVEEADIYKMAGNRLYYFNTYRGFIVYDVTDAKPVGPARPVYGYPVEMFVEGNIVYALLRDALYLTEATASCSSSATTSRSWSTIDVSDVAHPRVLKTLDIIGQLHEGVSRKIDSTIYVVSEQFEGYYWGWQTPADQREAQAWVYSYDISDPATRVRSDSSPSFQGGGGVSDRRQGQRDLGALLLGRRHLGDRQRADGRRELARVRPVEGPRATRNGRGRSSPSSTSPIRRA